MSLHDARAGRVGSGADDKSYDTESFVSYLESRDIKANIARKSTGSAVDGRTARGKGYAMSLRRRKMIEEAFGGGLRKTRHKGLEKLSGQALSRARSFILQRSYGQVRRLRQILIAG